MRPTELFLARSLEQLFNAPKIPAAAAAALRPIIRREEATGARSALRELPETQLLRPLLQLLGAEPRDEEEFVAETLLLLERRVTSAGFVDTLGSVRKAVELFHRFRVVALNGKNRVVLPVSHKEAEAVPRGEERTQLSPAEEAELPPEAQGKRLQRPLPAEPAKKVKET